MSEFKPVSTLKDLENLDSDEILRGYREGWDGAQEPGSDKSRSYWHGWRNAMADKNKIPHDSAMSQLAVEYVRRQRAH